MIPEIETDLDVASILLRYFDGVQCSVDCPLLANCLVNFEVNIARATLQISQNR